MKVLLARTTGDPGDSAVLDASLALARHLQSHIRVLHIAPDPRSMIPFMGESVPTALIEEIYLKAKADVEAAKSAGHARFDAWHQSNKLQLADKPGAPAPSAEWDEEIGDDYGIISRVGRVADLLILARLASASDMRARSATEAALFNTGRPALLLPPSCRVDLSRPCVIGWQGSREAARALAAALPLLNSASAIHIVRVAEKKDSGVEAEAAQTYLAWHGLNASVTRCKPQGSVATTLFGKARETNAGFLVMGAYSHTRFREMILGGVTEQVLTQADIPTLLCH